jgi:hypothetical protein
LQGCVAHPLPGVKGCRTALASTAGRRMGPWSPACAAEKWIESASRGRLGKALPRAAGGVPRPPLRAAGGLAKSWRRGKALPRTGGGLAKPRQVPLVRGAGLPNHRRLLARRCRAAGCSWRGFVKPLGDLGEAWPRFVRCGVGRGGEPPNSPPGLEGPVGVWLGFAVMGER